VKRFDPHRPLHRFALDDEAGTTIYVSSQTGEIVQNTTRSERVWNWLGAIPHWIYFAPIRRDQELWRQAVMWLSGPLVIGAISGLWIGILRLRPAAAKAGRSVSPYRGWMKWHHVGGLIGGLFLCTWIFSGWLSVNPFQWFARTQIDPEQIVAFSGWSPEKRLDVSAGALAAARGASDISFTWADGKPLMLARSASGTRMLHASSGNPTALPDEALIAAASRMYPSNKIVTAQRLTQETLYWYSHNGTRPLPANRNPFRRSGADVDLHRSPDGKRCRSNRHLVAHIPLALSFPARLRPAGPIAQPARSRRADLAAFACRSRHLGQRRGCGMAHLAA
jgi:hypothetical protein